MKIAMIRALQAGNQNVPLHDRAATHRRRVGGTTAAVLATAIFAAWLKLRIGGTTSVMTFDDVATALAAFTAAVLCWRAGLMHTAKLRRFWLLMAAASTAWTVAEIIWAVYDLVLHEAVPIPSWADVGYLSAIPLTVAALLSHPAMRFDRKKSARATFDGIVVATALLFLSWSLVLGSLWRHTNLTSFGGIVAIAYPFGDIIIIFLVLGVIRAMTAGDRFALGCVLAGLVAMALADSTYVYLTTAGTYVVGQLVDAGWVAGYLGLALGAFCSTGAEVEVAVNETPSAMKSLLVGFLPILLALGVLTAEIAAGRELYRSDWFIALVLIGLVLIRQCLMLFGAGNYTEVQLLDGNEVSPS